MAKKRPPMYLLEIVPPEEEPMKRIQHTFTAAELLNLKATPVTLLPAPGPGNRYSIFALFTTMHFGTVPYDMNGNTNITQAAGANPETLVPLSGLIDALADTFLDYGGPFHENLLASLVNVPLRATVDGVAEMLNGDGTLLLVIYYAIEAST